MSLLFDQNISPRLVSRLADIFPGASHVIDRGLDRASDFDLWHYARDHGFIIVTKDADFGDSVLVRGFPPKVVWLRLGNCTTNQIEQVLRRSRDVIEAFTLDPDAGILTLM